MSKADALRIQEARDPAGYLHQLSFYGQATAMNENDAPSDCTLFTLLLLSMG